MQGLSIANNLLANNVQYNLNKNQSSLQNIVKQLSSGLRINSAADDPSGLVISEQMRAQSAGLTQAIANANDGINLTKTAEAALNEVHSLLRNMRTLAVHAANAGVNDANDIAADRTRLIDILRSDGMRVNAIAPRTISLEDVFVFRVAALERAEAQGKAA